MKRYKQLAAIMAILVAVTGFFLTVTASEVSEGTMETGTLSVESVSEQEVESNDTDGTEAVTEDASILEGDEVETGSDVVSGIYEMGKQWAEEHPELFTQITTVVTVFIYALVQVIGWLQMKKPMIQASNNAVEIYEKAGTSIQQTLTTNKEQFEEMGSLVVSVVQEVRDETSEMATLVKNQSDKAFQEVCALAEEVRNEAAEVTAERRRERQSILLLAQVVSRLLEESALPARTREEIHALTAEAEARMKEVEAHEEDPAATVDE